MVNDSEVLLVRQAKGHPLEGQWTIPWGFLDAAESPADAAMRETLEESGVVVEVEGILGLQELPDPWKGWLAIVFLCRHIEGSPMPDGRETSAALRASRPGSTGVCRLP